MRMLILTLLVLAALPAVAEAKLHHKVPGNLPKPHALKKGADPQNPKVHKHHLLHHKH